MSTITPANAPRTFEGLQSLTSFDLRNLAEQLGGMTTAKEKFSWSSLKPEDRAHTVLALVKKWDETHANGAQEAPAAATTVTRTPVTAASVAAPITPVAPVIPVVGTEAAATAQAAMGAKASKRTPVTEAAAAAPAALPTEASVILQRLTAFLEGEQERFAKLQGNLVQILTEAANTKNDRITAIEGQYEKLQKIADNTSKLVKNVYRTNLMLLHICMQIAEPTLKATAYDVIKDAAENASVIEELLVQIAAGK